jgi:hypothetical protein
VLEKLIPLIGALVSPLIATALSGSRRNRLRKRVDDLLVLADKVRGHDAARAAELERLAGEAVDEIVKADRRSLRRRFDGSTAAAVVVMLVPGALGLVFASRWDSAWKWPALVASVLWILLTVVGGGPQMFTEGGDERAEAQK